MNDFPTLEKRLSSALSRIAVAYEELIKPQNYTNDLAKAVMDLEKSLSILVQSNTQLREINQKLRDANLKGVGDPALINGALELEIDNLKKEWNAEKSQINVLVNTLTASAEDQKDA